MSTGFLASRVKIVAPLLLVTMVVAVLAQDPDPQQPTFRTGVDVIEIDVSVLDRNRRPVRGLTADDFTVLEDGRPQRIVAVSSVDLVEHNPAQSARMRYVARDVAANDLSDQLGDGRLVAIVFDDLNLPADDPDILRSARETARYIVDRLGPSDMAAVVYSYNSGRTQDFTSDRSKLLDAIDRFQPVRSDWRREPDMVGPGNGALQQWSPTLARSSCMRGEPAVPTLDAVASRLATAPGRRKAVMFLSVGVQLSMSARDACSRELTEVMKNVYRKAQRANVNIYGIDPAGFGGYQDYVRRRTAQRTVDQVGGRRRLPRNVRLLQEFLLVAAENTGGRAIINTDAIQPAIDRILEEDRVYYIVGYEPSSSEPDGRFRRVEIRVNRPGVSVRSRSGYWAPTAGEVVDRRLEGAPSAMDATLSGLDRIQGVRLRAFLAPMARAGEPASTRAVDVAAVLSVKYPPIRTPVSDTLTITRNVYDTEGRAGPPVRVVESVQLQPAGGDETLHHLLYDLVLEPGQRQVRFHVQSALLRTSGTVYADVDVPDFSRSPLAMSGVILSSGPSDQSTRTGSLDRLLPVVPTSSREFSPNDVLTGFVRIHQAADMTAPVTVTAEVFDVGDRAVHQATSTLEPAAFEAAGGASYRFDVPLARLSPGPHLLSVTARLPGGRTARRDVVFRVR